MRTGVFIVSAFLAFAATAAQEASQDPGQTATPPRSAAPLPEKIRAPDDVSNIPAVKIHTRDNGDVVEEYRHNGRLYMVKVTPPGGIPYTLMDTNGDGLLDKSDAEGPVAPVYYTIYRWN